MSADVKIVRMLLANGCIAEFTVESVPPSSSRRAKLRRGRRPDPATKTPAPITVPTGTVLSVRLTQAIDVDTAQGGMTFKSVLDDPVMIGGQVVWGVAPPSRCRRSRSNRPARSKAPTSSP